MDSKTFTNNLAKRTDSDPRHTAALLSALAEIMKERGADLDSIALPGFGNFVAMKKAEQVVLDPVSGKRRLVPPCITVEFVASAALKKRIAHE